MGSSEAETVTIKVTHAGQTKRANFPRAELSYESLCDWMTAAFAMPVPLNHAPQPGCMMPRLAYRDPEGDAVTLSSNDELQEALRLKAAGAPLALQITFPRLRERWHRMAAQAAPAPECLMNAEPELCQAAQVAATSEESPADTPVADASAASKPSAEMEDVGARRRAIQAWRAAIAEARVNGTPLPPHPLLGLNHPVFRRHGHGAAPAHPPCAPHNEESCAANGIHGAQDAHRGPFPHHPHHGAAHHWAPRHPHAGPWVPTHTPAFGMPYPGMWPQAPIAAPYAYPLWSPFQAGVTPAPTSVPTAPAPSAPGETRERVGLARRGGHKECEDPIVRILSVLIGVLVFAIAAEFSPLRNQASAFSVFVYAVGASLAFVCRRRLRKLMKKQRKANQHQQQASPIDAPAAAAPSVVISAPIPTAPPAPLAVPSAPLDVPIAPIRRCARRRAEQAAQAAPVDNSSVSIEPFTPHAGFHAHPHLHLHRRG